MLRSVQENTRLCFKLDKETVFSLQCFEYWPFNQVLRMRGWRRGRETLLIDCLPSLVRPWLPPPDSKGKKLWIESHSRSYNNRQHSHVQFPRDYSQIKFVLPQVSTRSLLCSVPTVDSLHSCTSNPTSGKMARSPHTFNLGILFWARGTKLMLRLRDRLRVRECRLCWTWYGFVHLWNNCL